MSLTLSTMAALGTFATPFSLTDVVSGRTVSLKEAAGPKGLLAMFISRHCPYVQHVKEELGRIGKDYEGRGIGIVAIASNDAAAYPEDAPDKLKELALESRWRFPVCYDESQDVARAYAAACTPDFFLFDRRLRLAYRGQLDSSRPGSGVPVTGKDLRAALDAVVAGHAVAPEQKPSAGCNIKWRSRP
jgi:thiol-disulfide isomerase/thioredoxin